MTLFYDLTGIDWGLSNLFLVCAIQNTAVANVLVINAASPMFSAFFSWLLLGEVVLLRTILASAVCFAAIFVIFISEVGQSKTDRSDIGGIICALGSSITMGLYFVLLRVAEKTNGYVFVSRSHDVVL